MKRMALIADDDFINRSILADDLEADYDIVEAATGQEALDQIQKYGNALSVILLDIVMPEKTGLDVLQELKDSSWDKNIPVLVITGEQSPELKRTCYQYGVVDFINKPFDEQLVRLRTNNAAELYAYKNGLEARVVEQNDQLRTQNIQLTEANGRLTRINERIIELIGSMVEARSLESGEHVQRVKTFTRMLAEAVMAHYPEYGLTPDRVAMIASASALHDVGKISIPDGVLLKPGRLTSEEFEHMKTHTTKGSELIDSIDDIWKDDYKKISSAIARYHHERFDGRGYPDKLVGDAIPIEAQIVSIADVYDALVHERVYKRAFPLDVAYHMILNGECGTFNPKIIECFTLCRLQFESFVKNEGAKVKNDVQ